MVSGMLVEVQVLDRGSSATTDVAVGGTSVPVSDGTQFDDTGRVRIDDIDYDYTGYTDSGDGLSGTLTLATGLTVACQEFDPVWVVAGGQVAQDWEAVVDFGEGDNLLVPLPFSMRAQFPAGDYDPPVPVTVADDGSTITDAPGRAPVIDGSYIDPATVPPPAPPSSPPDSSPSLTATGDASGITLVTEGIDATTWLDFYVNGTPTTEAQGLHTRATVVRLTEDGTGAAMVADTDYTFHVVASNVAGSAAPSADTTTRLNAGVDSQTVLGWVAAGFVLAGSIQVGNITIDPNTGITIPLADGNQIAFPADGSAAVIDAVLRTSDIIIRGGLTLTGGANSVTGTLSLASGVVAPAAAPQVSAGVDTVATLVPADGPTVGLGLALSSDGTKLFTGSSGDFGADLLAFDRTTGAAVGQSDAFTGSHPLSVTRIGTTVYVLWRYDHDYYTGVRDSLRVEFFSESGNALGNARLTSPGGGQIIGYSNKYGYAKASLCTDGTSLYLVYVNGSGAVQIRQYATDGTPGTVVTTNWTGTGGGASAGVYNAWYGAAQGEATDGVYFVTYGASAGLSTTAVDPATGATLSLSRTRIPLLARGGVTRDTTTGTFYQLDSTGSSGKVVELSDTWTDTAGPSGYTTRTCAIPSWSA
ncbi:MAG: hypothetical protein ACRDRL_28940 [Sciscionella sp.]